MEVTQTNRTTPLKIGETEIAVITGRYKNVVYTFHVYYGNRVLPDIKGEFVHLEQEPYLRELKKFLNSEEGQKYIWPSKNEIEEASRLVISIESQHISKQEKDISNQVVQKEEPKKEETIQINSKNELELNNLRRRTKVLLVIVLIQFICTIALLALRILKL